MLDYRNYDLHYERMGNSPHSYQFVLNNLKNMFFMNHGCQKIEM
jgi:hypothetical protein